MTTTNNHKQKIYKLKKQDKTMNQDTYNIQFKDQLENNIILLQEIENKHKFGEFTGKYSSGKVDKKRIFTREFLFKHNISPQNCFKTLKEKHKEFDFELEETTHIIKIKKVLH
jgi:hypothetical protein